MDMKSLTCFSNSENLAIQRYLVVPWISKIHLRVVSILENFPSASGRSNICTLSCSAKYHTISQCYMAQLEKVIKIVSG